MVWTPVMFPPGRARLATSPASSKEPPATTTIGSVVVARLAIPAVVAFGTTRISTGSWTTSATRVANRSRLPSAQRHSMVMVCPSTQPRACSARRNTSAKDGHGSRRLRVKPENRDPPHLYGLLRGGERRHQDDEGKRRNEPHGIAPHGDLLLRHGLPLIWRSRTIDEQTTLPS